MPAEYIYLIREREFLKTGELIYKIGRTNNPKRRMKQYPKGSRIVFILKVARNIEYDIIKMCDFMFINRRDIGREYYELFEEADVKKIKSLII